jgi:flagellar basal body-associated protein FliL
MVKKIVPVIVLIAALGGVYKFVIAKPAAAAPKPKVAGSIYILGKEFLVNLADSRFAKLTVALELPAGDTKDTAASGDATAKLPDGFGTMPEEAAVRDVITDDLTGATADDLIGGKSRDALKAEILKDLKKHTDVKVTDVLFTDITVQ